VTKQAESSKEGCDSKRAVLPTMTMMMMMMMTTRYKDVREW
jgi:hypothetical protein